MRQRDIATSLILTIFTCGIYGIIWFVSITDDIAYASDDHTISGGMALLLTIVTCGIYGIYWSYKMGKLVYEAKLDRDMRTSDNSILYLILELVGLGIITRCMLQSELNDIARETM